MNIIQNNYCEYGRYSWLLQNQSEPLFLKPDGVRTRYCIGWNGYGRYIPGSLKVKYNGTYADITEEPNGIFYNFNIAPSGNYDDYEVTYVTRPLDYAFSTGNKLGGYEGEEYFLFPNWNNALGEGDAFWIGKWQASKNSSNIPQSKSGVNLWCDITRGNAITACKSKGNKFGMMRNRQWVSIARWCDHHEIHVKGNIYGRQTNNLDGDYTTLAQAGGGYNASNGCYFVTGSTIPDTWNHNGKSNGIHNMVGNIWEHINGLENRYGEIYIYDENDNYVDSGVSVKSSGNTNTNIVDITDTNETILNEGIANTVSTNGYIPSNLDGDYMYPNTTQTNLIYRGGSSDNGDNGLQAGLWTFSANLVLLHSGWCNGFRLSRKLI